MTFSDLAAFEAIYGFNKYFEKGSFYLFAREDSKLGNVFTATTDAAHREHRRKVVGPAFLAGKIAAYEPTVAKNVSFLVSSLAEKLGTLKNGSSVKGSALNVAPHIHRYAFETSIAVIYGQSMSSQLYTSADTKNSHEILAQYKDITKWAWAGSLLPWFGRLMSTRLMRYLTRRPTYDTQGNLTNISALTAKARDLIFEHPEKSREAEQPSILQNYLQVPKTDATHMEPDEIWRECFNLTIAGPGSTAAALTAVLHRLGCSAGCPWQRRIRASPTSSSHILLAVIKETLRLHAPFPTGFPREIAKGAETAIPHLHAPLPPGTLVSANSYVLGRSAEIWGNEAETWDPARWLTSSEDDRREMEGRFVAFSKGPRGCLGREVALLMITAAVRGLLARWEVDSEGEVLSGNGFLEMQYDECRLRFSAREDA